jgi:hypothetical protein
MPRFARLLIANIANIAKIANIKIATNQGGVSRVHGKPAGRGRAFPMLAILAILAMLAMDSIPLARSPEVSS